MGLIFTHDLEASNVSLFGTSKMGIKIPKAYFSEPFNLMSNTKVFAKLLKIENPYGETIEDKTLFTLEGMEIEFILYNYSSGSNDLLLITQESWNLIRDYEIIIGFSLTIKIYKTSYGDIITEIYPKKDLVFGN